MGQNFLIVKVSTCIICLFFSLVVIRVPARKRGGDSELQGVARDGGVAARNCNTR